MTNLRYICSSLTMGGLDSYHLSPQEHKFLQNYKPSGVTLFGRNIKSPQMIQELPLIREIKAARNNTELPFILAVDQEGGTVARLKHPMADPGPSLSLAEGKSDAKALDLIRRKGEEVGQALLTSGFNVNFAPSVDITNLSNKKLCAINTRSYGQTPEEVISRAGAFFQGLQKSGIYGCLKHFPGLGGLQIDTHLGTALADFTLKNLRDNHLKPFDALQKEASLVLVSHAIYTAFGTKEATRNPKIMTDLLRKEMGYTGLIVSDDLQMHAVNHSNITWEEYILESISAGCDLLLICQGLAPWKKACDVILLEAKNSSYFKKRVFESYERIQSFRQKLCSC